MIAGWGLILTGMGIPVDPNAPEAQRLLRDELAKPPYQAAQPTWFDRLSKAILDWFSSLSFSGDGSGGWIPLVLIVVGIGLLIAAIAIFGLPRRSRRRRAQAALFADDDRRSADELRVSAAKAASAGDWALASEEAFRAIAQGLVERTVLRPTPGTTAHTVAEQAASAFPDHRARLRKGASVFEDVRYLGSAGTERGYQTLVALDDDLRASRPTMSEPTAVAL